MTPNKMPKKLTPTELKTYEGILQHMLSVLSGDINQLEQEALGQGEVCTECQGDGGADSYAQEFSLELLEHEETTMREGRLSPGRRKTGMTQSWKTARSLASSFPVRSDNRCPRKSQRPVEASA